MMTDTLAEKRCANCGEPCEVLHPCPCGEEGCPCQAGVCRSCHRSIASNVIQAAKRQEVRRIQGGNQ